MAYGKDDQIGGDEGPELLAQRGGVGDGYHLTFQFAPGVEHALPLRQLLRARLHDDVEVVTKLLAVIRVVLQDRADELPRDVLSSDAAVPEIVRVQARRVPDRYGFGRRHHRGRLLDDGAVARDALPEIVERA